MPPKKKALAKPAKTPVKPRAVAPKEKSANMTQQEWDDEKQSCSILTVDRRRHCLASLRNKAEEAATAATKVCLSLGRTPSEAGSACYPLTGRSMVGVCTFSRSASLSSSAYFTEPPSRSLQYKECHIESLHVCRFYHCLHLGFFLKILLKPKTMIFKFLKIKRYM
jgi:hypothetical protein